MPIVRVKNIEERPGGAANVALNVASLGLNVQLLGITGNDEFSMRLESILKQKNVNCHFIRKDNFPTIEQSLKMIEEKIKFEKKSNKTNKKMGQKM